MKVLVIGGGGREHALAWKLNQSPKVQAVYVAPGNGGMAIDPRFICINLAAGPELAAWAAMEKIALTVVGPEQPLAAGIVDLFRAQGLRIFGPTQAAAQLESSKAFSKAFMQRHRIPTARFAVFTDAAAAHAYIDAEGAPIVVKADGLAAGKGVVVAMTLAEAHAAIDAMLPAGTSTATDAQATGARLVIEEFLSGEEASFIVLCDGKNVAALATSQDHKRLGDGDTGPNTGGMGAYSPAPVVTPEVHARAMREIILPTIRGMEKDGIRYTGFLYAGLMIDAQGHVKTLEFNCRLGDPETQPILMRLKTDLFDVLMAATSGRLDTLEMQWDRRPALGVVLASAGYPQQPVLGAAITGLPELVPAACPVGQAGQEDTMVFHAATQLEPGRAASPRLATSGGRVLCVTALGETVRDAQQRAYETVGQIHFDGMQYRRDIGFRALKP